MKCIGKEWDTCRVEKMGCKGCYYEDEKEKNIDDVWICCESLDGHWFYMNTETGERLPDGVQPIKRGEVK